MHPRRVIREAVKAALDGTTGAEDRVFASRVTPYRRGLARPFCSIYTLEEDVTAGEETSPRELTREVSLVIEGYVDPGSNVDDALDDFAEEVEGVMHVDPTFGIDCAVLDVDDSILTATSMDLIDDGDRLIGWIALTYTVKYFDLAPVDEELEDFKVMADTYNLGGAQSPTEQAYDLARISFGELLLGESFKYTAPAAGDTFSVTLPETLDSADYAVGALASNLGGGAPLVAPFRLASDVQNADGFTLSLSGAVAAGTVFDLLVRPLDSPQDTPVRSWQETTESPGDSMTITIPGGVMDGSGYQVLATVSDLPEGHALPLAYVRQAEKMPGSFVLRFSGQVSAGVRFDLVVADNLQTETERTFTVVAPERSDEIAVEIPGDALPSAEYVLGVLLSEVPDGAPLALVYTLESERTTTGFLLRTSAAVPEGTTFDVFLKG